MDELSVTIASWFDRDDLVIELESPAGDFGIVTIDPASGAPTIEIYPPPTESEWRFDLATLRTALEQAHLSALEIGPSAERADDRSPALAGQKR